MQYFQRIAAFIKQSTGEDAYGRYLEHQRMHHATQAPLSRKAFYHQRLKQKWDGINRCC